MKFTQRELEFLRYMVVHYLVAPHDGHHLIKEVRDAISLYDRIQEELSGLKEKK